MNVEKKVYISIVIAIIALTVACTYIGYLVGKVRTINMIESSITTAVERCKNDGKGLFIYSCGEVYDVKCYGDLGNASVCVEFEGD